LVALLEAAITNATTTQANFELGAAIDRLKAASAGVIEKNFEFFASEPIRPKHIGLLSMNGFEYSDVASVRKNLSILRERLGKRQHRELESLLNLESLLAGIHTDAAKAHKKRRLEELIAQIHAAQVDAPETTLQLNHWFAQLHEIDPPTHRHMCVTMEERFVKQPLSALNAQTEKVIGSLSLKDLEQGETILCDSSSSPESLKWLVRAGFERKLVEWVFEPEFKHIFAGFNAAQIISHRAAFEALVVSVTKRQHHECLTKSLKQEILRLLQPNPASKRG